MLGKAKIPGNGRGVTLLELLFTLGLIALLAGLAAPGLRAGLRTAAVRSATFDLLAGLQQIRAEAILRARTGHVCPADASGACLPPSAAGAAWRASLEDGSGEVLTAELPHDVRVSSTRSPVSFRPQGIAAGPGTLTICDSQGIAAPRAIVVSITGRARLTDAAREACNS